MYKKIPIMSQLYDVWYKQLAHLSKWQLCQRGIKTLSELQTVVLKKAIEMEILNIFELGRKYQEISGYVDVNPTEWLLKHATETQIDSLMDVLLIYIETGEYGYFYIHHHVDPNEVDIFIPNDPKSSVLSKRWLTYVSYGFTCNVKDIEIIKNGYLDDYVVTKETFELCEMYDRCISLSQELNETINTPINVVFTLTAFSKRQGIFNGNVIAYTTLGSMCEYLRKCKFKYGSIDERLLYDVSNRNQLVDLIEWKDIKSSINYEYMRQCVWNVCDLGYETFPWNDDDSAAKRVATLFKDEANNLHIVQCMDISFEGTDKLHSWLERMCTNTNDSSSSTPILGSVPMLTNELQLDEHKEFVN
jgi:hypothetical protein